MIRYLAMLHELAAGLGGWPPRPQPRAGGRPRATRRPAAAGESPDLGEAMARLRTEALEAQHRKGYELRPVEPSEVHAGREEQVWPD